MGALLGRPSICVESARLGEHGEQRFEAPLQVRIQLNSAVRAGWRVSYEVDVAHAKKSQVLLDIPPATLHAHTLDVPGTAFTSLLDKYGADAVSNVSVLEMAMHAEGTELLRLLAVVEVYTNDTSGALYRRLYLQPPPRK